MKLKDAMYAFTFDDFILVPIRSDIESRGDPNISPPGAEFAIPIISSPMNTITELEMVKTMRKLGGSSVIHRYMPIKIQAQIVGSFFGVDGYPFFSAIGANGDALERANELYLAGCRHICVDVANGYNIHCVKTVKALKNKWPDLTIMAGNICSAQGAERLIEAGAKYIRVGVGSGAVCTTRIVTAHGLPQLSAIEETAQIKSKFPNVVLIADGGIRNSGDMIKAFVAGADAIMLGSLLAGTKETPGEVIEEDGRLYKYYNGMASDEARSKWIKPSGLPTEGISVRVPYVGKSAEKIVNNLCDSIKVGLSYSGARNITELRERACWRRITTAGYIEGTPHRKLQ